MGDRPSGALDIGLLILLGAAYLWFMQSGTPRIAATDRIARYRRWLARAPLAFGGSALVALAAAEQLPHLWSLPPVFTPIVADARRLAGLGDNVGHIQRAVVMAIVASALAGAIVAAWRQGRGRRDLTPRGMMPLIPRNRRELGWAALLATMASVVEELYFRLALPLFATRVFDSAGLAMLVATGLFAIAHRGHGLAGMLFALLTGATLTLVYLTTGQLWFAMLAHALLNLNMLVLRPLLVPIGSTSSRAPETPSDRP